jgi:hypothetical protein
MQTVLLTLPDEAEMGICNVKVRIDTKGYGKKTMAITAIAIEEIPVVEISVRSRKSNRLRRLVYGVFVSLC